MTWKEAWMAWIKPRTVFAFMFYISFCILTFWFAKTLLTAEKINTEVLGILKLLIELLKLIVSTLLGFYFGSKVQQKKEG